MTLLDQLIPKKFGDKERFREDEASEILDISEATLRTLKESGELVPIETSPRRRLYTRDILELYLRKRNPAAQHNNRQ